MVGVSYPDYPEPCSAPLPDTSVAYAAGLREGDRIVAVDGTPVESWLAIFVGRAREPDRRGSTFDVARGDSTLHAPGVPEQRARVRSRASSRPPTRR